MYTCDLGITHMYAIYPPSYNGGMKPIKAVAVVKRDNPVLKFNQIFTHQDSLTTFVDEDEMKIKVMIVPVKGRQTVYTPTGRAKARKTTKVS